MAQDWRQTRLYTRYPFAAAAEIVNSGAVVPSRVMNISFGGCRLVSSGRLPVGAAITLKISGPKDSFEATAKVVHSTANELGVMFDQINQQSLLVLNKWITEARSLAVAE